MGNNHTAVATPKSGGGGGGGGGGKQVTTLEDMGAHILNADSKLKNVPWDLKQLYARRALEHAKAEHLQGGTNRALSPFWDKLKITQVPAAPQITTKRRELFKKSINVPQVTQPTLSQLGLSGGNSSRTASCSDDNTSSSEEEEEEEEVE